MLIPAVGGKGSVTLGIGHRLALSVSVHTADLEIQNIVEMKNLSRDFFHDQFDTSHIIAIEVSQVCEKDICRHCQLLYLLLTIIVALTTKKFWQ